MLFTSFPKVGAPLGTVLFEICILVCHQTAKELMVNFIGAMLKYIFFLWRIKINFPLEPTSRNLISVSSCPPSLPSAATDSQWMERTWQWTALLFDQNILYPLAPTEEDGSDLFRFYQADRRDYDNPELDYNHIISIYGEVPCSMYCITLQGAKTACCLNGKNKASSFLSGSSNCPLLQHIYPL